jgi:hypothetical protein
VGIRIGELAIRLISVGGEGFPVIVYGAGDRRIEAELVAAACRQSFERLLKHLGAREVSVWA